MDITKIEEFPSTYYVCKFSDSSDWKYKYQVTFSNDLVFYFASNHDENSADGIIEMLENDYNILERSKDYMNDKNQLYPAAAIQDYMYDEFDSYISYPDAKKIFDYLVNNDSLINNVLKNKKKYSKLNK